MPADLKSTAVCRAANGVCDLAESCDGVSNECPPDAYKTSSDECRAAADTCDAAENCNGGSAAASAIYDSIPAPLAPNVPSLGYEATSTIEFGDNIAFAGTNRFVTNVTVTMSAWAYHSQFPSMTRPAGRTRSR